MSNEIALRRAGGRGRGSSRATVRGKLAATRRSLLQKQHRARVTAPRQGRHFIRRCGETRSQRSQHSIGAPHEARQRERQRRRSTVAVRTRPRLSPPRYAARSRS
jgi:hypothetical protein